MFSPCYFHVIISLGILENNSLSLSTPSRTKSTLVYLLMLYSTSADVNSLFLINLLSSNGNVTGYLIYVLISDNIV